MEKAILWVRCSKERNILPIVHLGGNQNARRRKEKQVRTDVCRKAHD